MRHRRVVFLSFLLTFLLTCAALPLHALTVELGVRGGGGLSLMYGSFLDTKTADLAQIGGTSPSDPGSSQAPLFPGWIVGIYGQTDLLKWLALRVEVSYESAGAQRIALTSGGDPFDKYGVSFGSVNIPVLARARLPLGPGEFSGCLGPFLGILVGSVTVVDRYASSETTAVITPDIAHRFFFGFAGGIGYSLHLGPGMAGIELRSDLSILPVTIAAGQSGGDLNPIGVHVVVSYGIQVGGPSR